MPYVKPDSGFSFSAQVQLNNVIRLYCSIHNVLEFHSLFSCLSKASLLRHKFGLPPLYNVIGNPNNSCRMSNYTMFQTYGKLSAPTSESTSMI